MNNPRIPFQIASKRPKLIPPSGKRLMVHLVVNVEHWQFDQPMPRKLLTAPQGIEMTPDVPNYSWAEYGMRCGMPRILRSFQERSLPASVSINASVINAYPDLADEILQADWEFIGHGIHQQSIQAEKNEAETIRLALSMIEKFTGKQASGWLGPGLKESEHTPDILKSLGVEYVFDWVIDDLPCWMDTKVGPLMAMPYTLELNDSVIYAVEKHSSKEIYNRVVDTLKIIDREIDDQPQILTIALHPHLIGVPHRFYYFEKILDELQSRDDSLFMTAADIADWFKDQSPPPGKQRDDN
ncbi:MAG: hypothetical protein CMM75_00230 [Rhodospirillaceae bacterium]|nr:hypothetical protein [Rhodospirillaceae bacterium]